MKNNIVYGYVKIYDYEHSGDCYRDELLIRECGAHDTNLEFNGYGNTAYLNFEYAYSPEITAKLKENYDWRDIHFFNLKEFEE